MTVVLGCVSHLYQGDLDFGRVLLERLRPPTGVLVEDFSYGAVAVAQRLEELRPDVLVLVGAKKRGRPAATVERSELVPRTRAPADVQASVADAVTGYIDLELVVEVAAGLGALPPRTVVIEIEPATTEPSESLSPQVEAAIPEVLVLLDEELASFSVLE